MADRALDVAIIGGGVSGLYTAWRLTGAAGKGAPAVAVFEASDRLGGRLHTINIPYSSAVVEMGAMRLPASHVLVTSLLSQLGIPTEPFPNLPLRQMYLRGTPVPVDSDGPIGAVPFKLTGSENPNPFLLLLACLQRLAPEALTFTAADWDDFFKNSIYDGRAYWEWGFWNLISRVVSNEGYQLMQAALGIESSIANWNAMMSLPMMALLTQDFVAGKFSRPSNGWSELPEKLAGAVRAAAPESINQKHQVRRVRLTEDPARPFQLEFATPEGYTVQAARVVLSLPRRAIENLRLDSRLQYRKENLRARLARVGQISAFRFYVSYERPWWQSFSGWQHGYSITDLPVKQVFYGAGLGTNATEADQERVLMASYADYHSVDFWRGLIGIDHQPGMVILPHDSAEPDPLLTAVEAQLREAHRYMLRLPNADSVGYANWSPDDSGAAWHAWKPGGNLSEWIPEVRQPFEDLPLYICGEAYSNFQGWVEGALGSAENMLEKCFGLARPGWLPGSVDLGP